MGWCFQNFQLRLYACSFQVNEKGKKSNLSKIREGHSFPIQFSTHANFHFKANTLTRHWTWLKTGAGCDQRSTGRDGEVRSTYLAIDTKGDWRILVYFFSREGRCQEPGILCQKFAFLWHTLIVNSFNSSLLFLLRYCYDYCTLLSLSLLLAPLSSLLWLLLLLSLFLLLLLLSTIIVIIIIVFKNDGMEAFIRNGGFSR